MIRSNRPGLRSFGLSLLASTVLIQSGTAAARAEIPAASTMATTDPWYIGYASELGWNYSLGQIKAASAYQRGFTGAGQVVAVFDSGLNTANNQFIGRIAGPGFDAVSGRVGVTSDAQWHGTFVSGIIAADRDGIGMMGVAYDAKLLPVRIVNPDGSITLSDAQLTRAVNYATTAGARVFNNSWNSSTSIAQLSKAYLDGAMPGTLAAYRAAVKAGAIVVFAAGNDGKSQPGFYAALPTYYAELRAGWIAAVATDSTGAIASYSNRCGAAAAWCIAAPGSNIISVYNAGYASASGTSFAAPVLSAAASILKQEFPYLTNQQIIAILFQSANKTGIYANSAIYGQGLLDLNKATQPIGTLVVKSTAGAPVALASTSLNLGPAFGSSFAKSVGGQPLLVNDDFGRGYTVSLASVAAPGSASFDALESLQGFGGDLTIERRGVTSLSYAYMTNNEGKVVPARFFIEQSAGRAFASAGYHVDPTWALSARKDGITRGDLPFENAHNIPYLSLAKNATSFAFGDRLGGDVALRFGAFTGEALSAPMTAANAILPQSVVETASVTGVASALSIPVGARAQLGFDAGVIVEHGTLLGTTYSGAAAFGEDSPSTYTGANGSVALGPGLSLFGAAHIGLTQPATTAASIIKSSSNLVTTSFDVGIAQENLSGRGDRLGFDISQPLRVVAGTAHLYVPSAIDADGNALYAPLNANLAADGQELDLQSFYATPLGHRAKLNLGAMVRLEPGNSRAAGPDGVLISRYQLTF